MPQSRSVTHILSTPRIKPDQGAYDWHMPQVRNLIVFVVGLITLFTAPVLVGVIVCVVAVVGAIVTESRYRRGVPGSETFTGRPPKRRRV